MKAACSLAWAFQLQPQAGELLSSYLARVAHGHGTTAGAFCRFHLRDSWYFTRDVDRGATTRAHELLAGLAGVDLGSIGRLTLRSWMEVLTPETYSRDVAPAVVPWVNAVGIDQAKRRHRALAYCPECLQRGVALKRWRLSHHTWCSLHGRPLLDACGRCHAAFVPHLSRRSVANCHLCGAELAARSVGPLVLPPDGLVGLQERMDGWLDEACAGQEDARDRMQALRVLVSVGMMGAGRIALSEGAVVQPPGVCPRRRLEYLPVDDRRVVMGWLCHLVAGWPASFRELARTAGLTQRTFARAGLEVMTSTWLTDEVRRLPLGTTRRRAKEAAGSRLQQRVQRGASNWRAARAELLMKKVLARGN